MTDKLPPPSRIAPLKAVPVDDRPAGAGAHATVSRQGVAMTPRAIQCFNIRSL